ncbi:MAG: putative membrane protein insertion efficiency factor [candidate division WS2 bacterium ADurb.Bin280]|uniref:Putative membrane protein insertion efficiency factor n=1 Tax=candidate division WS2 bacterium ADurb.Bin280 TaxID=1852829 RepID=A0A1V5SF26_9BACT|nr:MAG: putative membrane protein insertion efficiency factor [candidate division WS2 bacterium ADurb.Bin280]
MFRFLAIKAIKVYQRFIGGKTGILGYFYPDGVCRFTPSCSQYALEAIEKKGFLRGAAMGAWRILRCNPWSKGGSDPVK